MSVFNNAVNNALFDADLMPDCITQISCLGKTVTSDSFP